MLNFNIECIYSYIIPENKLVKKIPTQSYICVRDCWLNFQFKKKKKNNNNINVKKKKHNI